MTNMMPNLNHLAILKILIVSNVSMRQTSIRKSLKARYNHDISRGRLSTYIKELEKQEYLSVDLRPSSKSVMLIPIIKVTKKGQEYYDKLRNDYIEEINHYNNLLGFEKLKYQYSETVQQRK